MLFASTSLVARIERAECRLLTDCAAALGRRKPGEVFSRSVAGGAATCADQPSPLNKVAGLGFGGPLVERELEEIEAAFSARGAPVQVELSTLADPSVGILLSKRGYVLRGFENVLGRALSDTEPPPANDEIEVAVDDEEGFATWLDLVVTGFANPDEQGVASHESFEREALEAVIRDMASADGFIRYVARRSGEPAGGASLRLFEGVANLCGAATLPSHRRRGVQTAMLAARLADARRAGCDVAVVTTQPGSTSQQNVQKMGFHLLYARAVLVLDS